MCGRFGLDIRPGSMREHFGVNSPPNLAPRYNIAPSQDAACVMLHPESGERVVRLLRFGLIPHWAKDAKIGYKLINARAETVGEKPAFRTAFAKRRLIVPASFFYEWQKADGRQPWLFAMKDDAPMGLAGLWERFKDKDSGETVFSFSIITVPANDLVARVHERMPAILAPADYEAWLGEESETADVHSLLLPYPPEAMRSRPVSALVNSPRNDGPELLAPHDAGLLP